MPTEPTAVDDARPDLPDWFTRVCPECRYNLSGLTDQPCPECGLSFDDRVQRFTSHEAEHRANVLGLQASFEFWRPIPVLTALLIVVLFVALMVVANSVT